ncbi:MAG: hypothetical protein JW741_16060 [Sedimentisphaerales bacterium]|nr:hypothetical protein [Sedimentisphaerales bacterium]
MVKEVEQTSRQCRYLIEWTQETLKNAPPVFLKRCERDGLAFEEMTLAEGDIEAYDGQPLCIEQPTTINTPELSPKCQDDRIRLILGATGDDPVPDVDEDTLLAYWKHLDGHLALPFEAEHCPEHGRHCTVTVVCLADPEEYDCDEFYGLFCEARLGRRHVTIPLGEIEAGKSSPNHQLIDDYSYWFWNWR